jgi:hypothetical protein
VRLGPSHRARIAPLLAVLVLTTGCISASIDGYTGESQAHTLRQTGVPAWATILRIWDTGITLNDDPVIGMEVEVQPEEGDPFRAVIPKSRISRIAIPQFQPGKEIAVRYDPRDSSQVALDDPPVRPWAPSSQR